jgi:hypothetical protein
MAGKDLVGKQVGSPMPGIGLVLNLLGHLGVALGKSGKRKRGGQKEKAQGAERAG